MPKYGEKSAAHLETCSRPLQVLFSEVVQDYDNSVLEGHRGEERQNNMVATGRSKTPWPRGKHNTNPSQALDAAPYIPGRGVPWPQVPEHLQDLGPDEQALLNQYIKDIGQFYHFAGYVEGTARQLGIGLRWGGDWDRDHNISDQTFDDLVHFEETD